MDRYAVIGHPVEHSKSPLIHAAFAQQTEQQLEYGKVLAPLDGFAAAVAEMQAQGYSGANVTVPFKFEAYELATELTPRARQAGAVNTLSFRTKSFGGTIRMAWVWCAIFCITCNFPCKASACC